MGNNEHLSSEMVQSLVRYMESVAELKMNHLKGKLVSDYIFLRNMLESANHNYRNISTGERSIMTDRQYDYYENLLSRMEEDNPEIKEFFDKYLGKISITERVG